MTIPSKENVVVLPSLPIAAALRPHDSPARIRVLLVDDDDDFREAAASELDYLGFAVISMADGDAMVRYFSQGYACDAILLDWKLPRLAGVDYLRSLRQRNVSIPVIILTALPETSHENIALDCGAQDFIDKSRGLDIVAKRIRRAVTVHENRPARCSEEVRAGNLLLRLADSRAYWDGIDLNLTVTEFNIVRLMVDNAGEHVTYRAIYDCVHHPGFVAGSGEDGYRTNVRSAVKRIRNKFRALDDQFSQIENFSAFGYRWRPPSV